MRGDIVLLPSEQTAAQIMIFRQLLADGRLILAAPAETLRQEREWTLDGGQCFVRRNHPSFDGPTLIPAHHWAQIRFGSAIEEIAECIGQGWLMM
jgi:hypothetical protein